MRVGRRENADVIGQLAFFSSHGQELLQERVQFASGSCSNFHVVERNCKRRRTSEPDSDQVDLELENSV